MSLKTNLFITLQNRKAFKKILENHTIDQINTIPQGFNNNLIWNVAHCISVQQTLVNKIAGRKVIIPEIQVAKYHKGTKPDDVCDDAFVALVSTQLFSSMDDIEEGISNNEFGQYTPFMTSLKVEIADLDTAIAFNQYHEGLHMGYILNIMRFLK